MVGIEHFRTERQPGLAVLEQIAEAVRLDLYGHAGKRFEGIEENFFDQMGMDVDLHESAVPTIFKILIF